VLPPQSAKNWTASAVVAMDNGYCLTTAADLLSGAAACRHRAAARGDTKAEQDDIEKMAETVGNKLTYSEDRSGICNTLTIVRI